MSYNVINFIELKKKNKKISKKYDKPIVAVSNKWIFQFKESILVQFNA